MNNLIIFEKVQIKQSQARRSKDSAFFLLSGKQPQKSERARAKPECYVM